MLDIVERGRNFLLLLLSVILNIVGVFFYFWYSFGKEFDEFDGFFYGGILRWG